MPDTTTAAKALTIQTIGGNNNTWGTIENANLTLIDKAVGGQQTKAITTDTTLSSTEAQNSGYSFTGTLVARKTITWPAAFYGWMYAKNATGYELGLTMGGNTVTLPNGSTGCYWGDGTNWNVIKGPLSFSANLNNVTQAITSNLYQRVVYTTLSRNDGSYFVGGGSGLWTPPKGLVHINWQVWIQAHAGAVGGSIFVAKVIKNAVDVLGTSGTDVKAGIGTIGSVVGTAQASASCIDYASGTDAYGVYMYATGDGNPPVIDGTPAHTWFNGTCFPDA